MKCVVLSSRLVRKIMKLKVIVTIQDYDEK